MNTFDSNAFIFYVGLSYWKYPLQKQIVLHFIIIYCVHNPYE